MTDVTLPAGYADSREERASLMRALASRGVEGQVSHIVGNTATLAPTALLTGRGGAYAWDLGTSEVPASAGSRYAHLANEQGLQLVEFHPLARRAVVAPLPPLNRALINFLATELGSPVQDFELTVAFSSGGDPATVKLTRTPVAPDRAKQHSRIAALVEDFFPVDATRVWRADSTASALTLTCGVDVLRSTIPFDVDVSQGVAVTEPWVLGIDDSEKVVSMDLANSAHLLIAGATRSGKSVCTYLLLTHVIRMGDSARLLVADPNDTTVGPFEDKVSWSTSDVHPQAVVDMLRAVRAEMDRRKPILREMRADKVDANRFSPELPMLVVVIDEAANYLKHADKDAAAAMANELAAVAAQGAKYGVRLVLITQRPDSTILPTATRAQLSARITFRLEDLQTASMVFPDIDDPSQVLSFAPGVGLIKEVGELSPRRFRGLFMKSHWDTADALAQPLPKFEVPATSDALAPARGPARTKPAPAPAIPRDLWE